MSCCGLWTAKDGVMHDAAKFRFIKEMVVV